MSYDNTNTGALFKNDKGDNDKRPDYKGPLNVGGTDYEVAAWLTKSKEGKTYMRLKVQEPRQKRQKQDGPPQEQPPQFSDDIPF